MKPSACNKAVIRSTVRDIIRDLDSAFDLDLALDRHLAFDHARKLTANLDRARELTADLDRACDLARILDLDTAHARAEDLVSTLARIRDHARIRDLDHALFIALNLADAIDSARTVSSQGRRVETARFAGRLVEVATRILPVMDQVRYGEEFRSELAEVARAGGGRWTQMTFAARLLTSAWSLRAELRDPQRHRALP